MDLSPSERLPSLEKFVDDFVPDNLFSVGAVETELDLEFVPLPLFVSGL